METVVPPPADAELHLLTDWGDPAGRARMGRSAVLSLLTHAAAIVFLLFTPEMFKQPKHRESPEIYVTPLFLPRMNIPEKETEHTRTIHEIPTSTLRPRPQPPAPTPAPTPAPEGAAARKAAAPPSAPPQPPKPVTPLPEPPKVDIAANEPPKLPLPVQPPQVAPPKPRPHFEDVTPTGSGVPLPPGQRTIDIPGPSVADAIAGSLRGHSGTIPGLGQIPTAGADLPQLLSDPKGVDFTPYLLRVRNSVKRYWDTIMPRAVTVGKLTGTVCVQFAIQRDGSVRTTAFCQQTGNSMLDNTAILAISGGSPFGSLPPNYKPGPGQADEIHVMMTFVYNAPVR